MFIRSLRGAGVGVLFASLVGAQAVPDGHWEGTLMVDNREIRLSLDLARNQRSEWIASMGLPSENATGLYVKDLAVSGKSVTFVAFELQMATFDLVLNPDGKMAGQVSNHGNLMPIEFRRTGEAKVELIPASPAVSKELEGDWEGSLQMPNGELRLVIHFRNQPDKTVAATMDTPVQGAAGTPLNNVKQTGQKVEFAIKVADASFQGSLNKEGKELIGQFTHEENSLPLTLKKR
jgi:hypothetical protein